MKRFSIQWGKPPRFVCDVHLAKVAKYLRLLGFDTWYRVDLEDEELLSMCRFGRIGVTCDRRLHERDPQHIVLLGCEDVQKQIVRLNIMFSLVHHAHPFRRCLLCNHLVMPIDKRSFFTVIPKESYRWLDGFWQCAKCKRVYWMGTHAKNMRQKIDHLLELSKKVSNASEEAVRSGDP